MESVKSMIEEQIRRLEEEGNKEKEVCKELQRTLAELQKSIAKRDQEIQVLRSVFKIGETSAATSTTEPKLPKQEEEERATFYYAIFNGPNKGIFDSWSKAAVFITGKNVTHKKYNTLEEAKKAVADYEKQYAQVLKAPATSSKRTEKVFPVIGKIPRSPTINLIQSRREKEKKTTLTKEKFVENLHFLLKYTEEDKKTHIYPIGSNFVGPKAVVLPEAEPLQTYMLFQSGLAQTIYFEDMGIFEYFPEKIKMTIDIYRKNVINYRQQRQGYLKIHSTTPIFLEGEDEGQVLQQAIQVCQVGISNRQFPEMDEEITTMAPEVHFLNNYILVLTTLGNLQGRINYVSPAIIIWSRQEKKMEERDENAIIRFMERMNQIDFPYPKELGQKICARLLSDFPEKHACQYCAGEEDIERISEEETGPIEE